MNTTAYCNVCTITAISCNCHFAFISAWCWVTLQTICITTYMKTYMFWFEVHCILLNDFLLCVSFYMMNDTTYCNVSIFTVVYFAWLLPPYTPCIIHFEYFLHDSIFALFLRRSNLQNAIIFCISQWVRYRGRGRKHVWEGRSWATRSKMV
jgi:hypothetical protein